MKAVYRELERTLEGAVHYSTLMAEHTTLQVGGPADMLIIPATVNDLVRAIKFTERHNISLAVIGNGSNTLFPDAGFGGIVVKLRGGLDRMEFDGEKAIVGAGVFLPNLLLALEKQRLCGLEFMAGVPATLGGAVAMNFGAFGKEIGSFITGVKVVECRGRSRALTRIDFGYRSTELKGAIVTEVTLKLTVGSAAASRQEKERIIKQRKATHPLDHPSAGSVFRNPEGGIAGKLLEKVGMKGLRIGGAQVSEKHANVIINAGGAKAGDILALMEEGERRVWEKFKVNLVPEIKVIAEGVREVGYSRA